jgi:hypothetical protein
VLSIWLILIVTAQLTDRFETASAHRKYFFSLKQSKSFAQEGI